MQVSTTNYYVANEIMKRRYLLDIVLLIVGYVFYKNALYFILLLLYGFNRFEQKR